MSSTWYQVLGRYLVLDTWCQVLSTSSKHFVPSTSYQALRTKYRVPGTWYQVPGTRYLLVWNKLTQRIVSLIKCLSTISFHEIPFEGMLDKWREDPQENCQETVPWKLGADTQTRRPMARCTAWPLLENTILCRKSVTCCLLPITDCLLHTDGMQAMTPVFPVCALRVLSRPYQIPGL